MNTLVRWMLAVGLCSLAAWAEPPPGLINFQGRLVQGTNLVNGVAALSARLYNVPVGGSVLYEDSNAVTVVDGLYATFIGDQTNAGNFASALTNTEVYIALAVNGGAELSPRERLASVAYSLNADRLDGLSAEQLALGADLTAEQAARIAADASLSNAVATEAASRAAADAALVAADASLSNAVAAETSARVAADSSLSNAVTAEAASRAAADAALVAADASLSNAVAAETSARIAADASLSNAVAAETSARIAADAALSNAVGQTWSLAGNTGTTAGTHFLGTTDNQAFDIRTFNQRVARFDTATNASGALVPNVILGHSANFASNGTAFGSVIGGGESNLIVSSHSVIGGGRSHSIPSNSEWSVIAGGDDNDVGPASQLVTIGGGWDNNTQVDSDGSTIGGGWLNDIGSNSTYVTIAGGQNNNAGTNTDSSVISGGENNNIGLNSTFAVIPGGRNNTVGSGATNAFAAGRRAVANHRGAFVWADDQNVDFTSTAANQFLIRASGGVGIGTANATQQLVVAGNAVITGTVSAASFSGDGAGVTNVTPAAHAHSGADITSGTVAEPRIDAAIARDSEIVPAVLAADGSGSTLDADLLDGLNSSAFATGTPVYAETDPVWNAEKAGYATGTPLYAETDASAWRLGGNANTTNGTHFLGTINDQNLDIRVNNQRVLRMEVRPYLFSTNHFFANIIGGSVSNYVSTNSFGCFIGAGGDTSGPGYENRIENGLRAFIGGGLGNYSYGDSVIVGGSFNSITEYGSFIGAGVGIRIDAYNSVIPGGYENIVASNAQYSVIGGGETNVVQEGLTHSVIAGGRDNQIATDSGGGFSFSAIGGGASNVLFNSTAATIAGGNNNIIGYGDYSFIGGGLSNRVADSGNYSTIGGGEANFVDNSADHAFIGGGQDNSVGAGATHAVVAGGWQNAAGGIASTVAGGQDNWAANTLAFAAGNRAKALHPGAFVWGDASDEDIESTNANSVTMRATGGFRLFTETNNLNGAELPVGGGSWITFSDRNSKDNVTPVNPRDIVEKVAALPVATWNYKSQGPAVRHIGPMAQDFHAAFGVGERPTGITSVDADGVALAAIQGLYQIVQEQQRRIEELEAELQGVRAPPPAP